MAKYNHGDIIQVRWADHYSAASGWRSLDSIKGKADVVYYCNSVGVVVDQNKDQLILAQSWSQFDGDPDKASDCIVILKKAIDSTRVLKRKVFN